MKVTSPHLSMTAGDYESQGHLGILPIFSHLTPSSPPSAITAGGISLFPIWLNIFFTCTSEYLNIYWMQYLRNIRLVYIKRTIFHRNNRGDTTWHFWLTTIDNKCLIFLNYFPRLINLGNPFFFLPKNRIYYCLIQNLKTLQILFFFPKSNQNTALYKT